MSDTNEIKTASISVWKTTLEKLDLLEIPNCPPGQSRAQKIDWMVDRINQLCSEPTIPDELKTA